MQNMKDQYEVRTSKTNPNRLVGYLLAGVLFLLMQSQVFFPGVRLPVVGIVVSAMAMVDFVSHEMGHVVLSFFGEFITVLGGTLAQLFIPTVCLLLTIQRRQWFYISLFSFWIGQSLIQISTYIRDAQTQQLDLFSPGSVLGGAEPIHDWNFLLDSMGLLWADQILGGMVFVLGLVLMAGAAFLMFYRAVVFFRGNS
ncbi:MAG: hypothetical protein GX577_07260 [Leptolinea sp.]|nr:hypothetical protein [Leptolinea sp.]